MISTYRWVHWTSILVRELASGKAEAQIPDWMTLVIVHSTESSDPIHLEDVKDKSINQSINKEPTY